MDQNPSDDARFDAKYQAWLKDNPGKRFSEYFDAVHVPKIGQGVAHNSLGQNLKNADWRDMGKAPFTLINRIHDAVTGGTEGLPQDMTICDFGCGTLRVGAHIMAHLAPGRYIGLDISQALVDNGSAAWADRVAERQPLLGTFDTTLDAAIAAAPDLVFAFNVACHIHPDEEKVFFDRIKSLLHKPGARVFLHVIENEKTLRYQESGWAHPRAYYIAQMHPLKLRPHPLEFLKTVEKPPHKMAATVLVFERA
ncbi:class I SAM-dependent methyltransferase [Ruegeria pomeroyi]|uniref:Class I SAM-dependent methyltransferase n=1 Tax=Ruegeria pomeroyi TaxID=89184 RepID=A0A9Q3ZS16_9RHOB|nr:class I SAM-dependent methyltransferase [Ruegeria pomeroyi]MCE8540164.1 class I SAM-dependent methyltransferase [Ruegeria pomeroyi]